MASGEDPNNNNNSIIQIGVIGCAGIARKLCRAFNLSPNATLSAIASRSIDKAKAFASQNGFSDDDNGTSAAVRIYGSYEELVDDKFVDAVYMPLPTSLHLHWALLAAQKKKHLLLEKPAALNVGELDRILEACESNGVQFMDGSMWFHHPRTARMKELLSDSNLFGKLRSIHSTSTFSAIPEFLEKNIRVKPDLDGLGALGDLGWYCIGSILWASNYKLPTSVTALPGSTTKNSAGVILSCGASFLWDDHEEDKFVATFHCSFLSAESMDLSISGSNGSLNLQDYIIPFQENCASFNFTSGAKFADLHIGWNLKPEQVRVTCELPQEALMVQEFARLVKGIRDNGNCLDARWPAITRNTQLLVDAVKKSIDLGSKSVYL